MAKLRVLSLFAGIGGFDLGLERTGGFETVAFCEIDPFCQQLLAKHWPGVPCYDDVRELTGDRLRADGIAVDVICGGFPCQDISLAGDGAGIDGERSGVWREYARLIGEVRPCYILVENVAALRNRGLDRVLGDMAALGYDAEWHCIPASAVGAPHRRDRIWIIAYTTRDRRGSRAAGRFDPSSKGQRQQAFQIASDASPLLGLAQLRQQQDRAVSCYWPQDWAEYAEAIRGMDDGVPGRVDGLAALGNSLTPVIPELIGNAILASMQSEAT